MNKVRNEPPAAYVSPVVSLNNTLTTKQQGVVDEAISILFGSIKRGDALCSPAQTREYLQLQLGSCQHEVFACLFLDNRNRVIAFEKLFRGTIDGASVYPREVAKECLKHNAAAVIFAHNHPSFDCSPSDADKAITKRLKKSLALLDIRVLDHFVIGDKIVSFAERGLL